jgi:hypothetical protein
MATLNFGQLRFQSEVTIEKLHNFPIFFNLQYLDEAAAVMALVSFKSQKIFKRICLTMTVLSKMYTHISLIVSLVGKLGKRI